eukprot:4408620-Alexandrium_andersonii.AAC.1
MVSLRQNCRGRLRRSTPTSALCRQHANSACAEMGSSSGPGSPWPPGTRRPSCGGARSPGGCRSPARPWPAASGPP